MALRKPKEHKDSNLSLLVQALAQAYHRGPGGRPAFQPISFKTGISTAAIHLWKNSAVKSVRPDYLHTLADCYRLDFAKVLAYVYGAPGKLEGDALLATLRTGDEETGETAKLKRVRPIRGGSALVDPLPARGASSRKPSPTTRRVSAHRDATLCQLRGWTVASPLLVPAPTLDDGVHRRAA